MLSEENASACLFGLDCHSVTLDSRGGTMGPQRGSGRAGPARTTTGMPCGPVEAVISAEADSSSAQSAAHTNTRRCTIAKCEYGVVSTAGARGEEGGGGWNGPRKRCACRPQTSR